MKTIKLDLGDEYYAKMDRAARKRLRNRINSWCGEYIGSREKWFSDVGSYDAFIETQNRNREQIIKIIDKCEDIFKTIREEK